MNGYVVSNITVCVGTCSWALSEREFQILKAREEKRKRRTYRYPNLNPSKSERKADKIWR